MAKTIEELKTLLYLLVSVILVVWVLFLYQPAYEAFTQPMLQGLCSYF